MLMEKITTFNTHQVIFPLCYYTSVSVGTRRWLLRCNGLSKCSVLSDYFPAPVPRATHILTSQGAPRELWVHVNLCHEPQLTGQAIRLLEPTHPTKQLTNRGVFTLAWPYQPK